MSSRARGAARRTTSGVLVGLVAGVLATTATSGVVATSTASATTLVHTSAGTFVLERGNAVVEEVTPAGKLSIYAGETGKPGLPKPGPARASQLGDPYGLALDVHGDLFIGDESNGVVEEVTPAGELSVVAGTAGKLGAPTPGPAKSSQLGSVFGVAVNTQGELYIADQGNDVVERVSPARTLSVVAGLNGMIDPYAVAANTAADLFVADPANEVVDELTPAGVFSVAAGIRGEEGVPRPGPATGTQLGQPYGLAVDAHGDLYIADPVADVVEKVTPAGELSIVAGIADKPGTPKAGHARDSRLDQPYGLALGAQGDLYIADTGNQVVEKVTPAGELSIVAGMVGKQGSPTPGPATGSKLGYPFGLAVNSHGDLFIADSSACGETLCGSQAP
jgi:hypothetical protein